MMPWFPLPVAWKLRDLNPNDLFHMFENTCHFWTMECSGILKDRPNKLVAASNGSNSASNGPNSACTA